MPYTYKDGVNNALENWSYYRGLALDILKSLSDDQLSLSVGKNMGTLGAQFRHMGRVQVQYVEAIENKKVGEVQERYEPDVAESKEKLIGFLGDVNKRMQVLIGGMSNEEMEVLRIDWTYWQLPESMGLIDHLNALTEHEILHNGQLIVYLRTHDISFPKSWSAWGL